MQHLRVQYRRLYGKIYSGKSMKMIIDSHLHLPWEAETMEMKKAALLAELERNGVEKGLVIADSVPESVIGSVRDCTELLRGSSIIKVAAGISPLNGLGEQLAYCRELLEAGDIAAVKLYTGHEKFFCTDAELAPVFDMAEDFDVPVLFHTGWDDNEYSAPERMRELALSRPRNKFVYCHCFYPLAERCFGVLGDCGNVFFDTSSVADDESLIPALKPVFERAVSLMPERMIFGSDFGSCSQEAHIRFAEELEMSGSQRELFMHGNAERLYRF
jgi:hypothetical protein